MQQQQSVIRWVARTIQHAIDSYAWIGSALAALLGVIWIVQTQLGLSLPAGITVATANSLGYWSGRASLILLIAVLIQAAARAGMDEERLKPRLSPEHIRDLQQQAAQFGTVLAMPHHYFPLGAGSVLATYYIQHFPNVAATISEWNDQAGKWSHSLAALRNRVEKHSTRSIEDVPVSISGVLSAVAMGSYSSPMEVAWFVQHPVGPDYAGNLTFDDTLTNQPITLATIPQEANSLQFAEDIQAWLGEARVWPESIEYRKTVQRLEELRLALRHQLEATQLNHSPGGTCDGCRPNKN
jgi:hypothetical protein